MLLSVGVLGTNIAVLLDCSSRLDSVAFLTYLLITVGGGTPADDTNRPTTRESSLVDGGVWRAHIYRAVRCGDWRARAKASDKIQLELLYSERELSYLSFLPTCRAREAHADGIINATPGRR